MSKLFDKAAQAVKRRNYDYAIELFLQELTRDPNNADARRALRAAEMKKFQESGTSPEGGVGLYLKALGPIMGASISKMTKKYEKAMLACEAVLKHAPRHKGTLKLLGDTSLLAGHTEAAKVAFDDLLDATDRRSEHALRSLARIYREEDDLAKALAYYERLRKVSPSDAEAAKAVRDLAAAGVSKKVEENRSTGDGCLRDMMKDGDKAAKLEAKGKRVRTTEDAQSAVERLKGELTDSKDDARLWKQIGDLHIKAKEYDEAIAAYETSLDLKPTNSQVKDALGDVRLKLMDLKLQKLLSKAKKGDATAQANAKKASKERLRLGIEEFERRVKDRPTELVLRYQLGSQLYKAKQFDDAIGHLQRATGDPRKGINARVLLGKCFASKGMHDLAVKELSKARDSASGDASKEITYNLAIVLEKAGKSEEAVTEYEKVIEADYNYKDARKRLEALSA